MKIQKNIKDVKFTNCNVYGTTCKYGGGIMGGYNFGEININNCTFTGSLHNSSGGIAGGYCGYSGLESHSDNNTIIKINTCKIELTYMNEWAGGVIGQSCGSGDLPVSLSLIHI